MNKKEVYNIVSEVLETRIKEIQSALKVQKEGLTSESKSSAGDKHNTSRAMMHLEQEKLGKQLAQFGQLKKLLFKINPDSQKDIIGLGSLVETTNNWFYIGVPLGRVFIGNQEVMAISLASPIGKILNGKSAGAQVSFNGNSLNIITVL